MFVCLFFTTTRRIITSTFFFYQTFYSCFIANPLLFKTRKLIIINIMTLLKLVFVSFETFLPFVPFLPSWYEAGFGNRERRVFIYSDFCDWQTLYFNLYFIFFFPFLFTTTCRHSCFLLFPFCLLRDLISVTYKGINTQSSVLM